jgi:hypothetical protein
MDDVPKSAANLREVLFMESPQDPARERVKFGIIWKGYHPRNAYRDGYKLVSLPQAKQPAKSRV